MKKIKKLSDNEWTLIWSSMRYFMGRMTIVSATFPDIIIKDYFLRMSKHQKLMLYDDMKSYLENNTFFGNKDIDDPRWQKFMSIMNEDAYVNVLGIDNKKYLCFKANNRFYSIERYLNEPWSECYIDKESIKEITSIINQHYQQ